MVLDLFSLKNKTALVTGGEGLLGKMICQTIAELGGTPISVDLVPTAQAVCDITNHQKVQELSRQLHHVDILVNAAVGNQKPVDNISAGWGHDINVGLGGALNMIGAFEKQLWASGGVILNIGSDLGLIGPDPSLYASGSMKPVSYSVVKHGIVGLTRYFAVTWGERVRCNCLCPGGVDQGQKLPRVPMGRLARLEEMAGPVAFMISEASSYMNGAIVSVDGGRTCW